MPSVREYDFDAYQRKFKDTLTKLENGHIIYVKEIGYDENGEIAFLTEEGKVHTAKPVYEHFKAGFAEAGKVVYCFRRKAIQSFHVGLGRDNYSFSIYKQGAFVPISVSGYLQRLSLYPKPDPKLALEEEQGYINDKMFVTKEKLFYLTMPIALREGHEFQVIDPSIAQEVSDALRGLTYKGTPCVVTSL